MDLIALKFVAIGLVVFGMLGAALGIARIFEAMLNGISRNPESENKMKGYVYIGAAMVEIMGLLAFLIAVLLIYTT